MEWSAHERSYFLLEFFGRIWRTSVVYLNERRDMVYHWNSTSLEPVAGKKLGMEGDFRRCRELYDLVLA